MLILDTEVYKDYFLVMFKEVETSKVRYFELFAGHGLKTNHIQTLMQNHTSITFNGNGYDLPIIVAALEGWDNEHLKAFSDKIIKSNLPSWSICKKNNIVIPDIWDTIDIIDVAPGIASLKLYGARLGAPKIQDLPIAPDDSILPEMREKLRTYCINDLATTELLYNALAPQIRLRKSMSEQYGIDLRSKSDAQIAEAVIKSELKKKTGKTYKPLKIKDGTTIKYQDPKIVSFQSDQLNDIFDRILGHGFELGAKIKMPKWLKDTKIKIGNSTYQMGVGGLHSTEKNQLVEARDGILCEMDVRGFYPSIILQQNLAPKSMGKDFIKVYQTIVEQRNNAKSKMQEIEKEINLLEKGRRKEIKARISELKKEYLAYKTESDTKKITTNSSYGKLGNKYSALYAPELLLQTTITGQLCLLMLIEAMEASGISIMSANTDGIVCHCPKTKERTMTTVAWDWELTTSYCLERTDYQLVASRDVNSYLAIKANGTVKRKGIFNTGGLMKNPDRSIIYDAVVEFLANRTPIEDTIRGCKDITKFISARKVTGGATFNGELLGKTVRFYSSNDTFFNGDSAIYYVLSKNKVPKSGGCKPLMELCDGLPDDLNYQTYIDDAEKLLLNVGWEI